MEDLGGQSRHQIPTLHSPPSSDYAESLDERSHHHDSAGRARSTSTASSNDSRAPFPPPPRPLDYETQPRSTRPPLPTPPSRAQRPALPSLPPQALKGKGRPLVLSEEKQAYARALGLDPLTEEGDDPTSPTSPPGYVQDREADAREGLSKTSFAGRDEAPLDEKGRTELMRVAETLEQEVERELEENSLSEKARMAREQAESCEEERLREEAVVAAELAKEASRLHLDEQPESLSQPLPPFTSSHPPTTDLYPLDSKSDSPTNSHFGSQVDDAPPYEPAPSSPILREPPAANYSGYGHFPSSSALAFLPPPPLQQRYATEPQYLRHHLTPPTRPPQLSSSPSAPLPTSYTSDQPAAIEFGAGRPPLARHMSLQPAASRTSYSEVRAPWEGDTILRSETMGLRSSTGANVGFYGAGIGSAMHSNEPQVFASGSDRSSSPRSHRTSDRGEAYRASDQQGRSYSPELSYQPSKATLLHPSAFSQGESVAYHPQVAPAPSHVSGRLLLPSPSSPPGQPQQHLGAPPQLSPTPIISSLTQPTGYYTISPHLAPIPFYSALQQQVAALPTEGRPSSARLSSLPPPPPPHTGYGSRIPSPQAHRLFPPVASPPLHRPASLAPSSASSIRAHSRGSMRSFFGRRGKKDTELSDVASEENDRSSLWSWK